jgi:hypothetical protein
LVCSVVVGSTSDAYAAVHARARPLCARFRCEIVAADANVRVLKLTGRQRFSEYLSHAAVWKPTGRTTMLGDHAEFLGGVTLARFALAGPFVGVSTYTFNHENGEVGYSVTRLNAKTGRRETVSVGNSIALLRQGCLPGGSAPTRISALVIRETGAMAWISVQLGLFASYPGVNVCELPPGAHTPAVLAHDLTIARDSLALAGHTLYWTQDGQPHSALLN